MDSWQEEKRDQTVIDLLERIAIALEKLAHIEHKPQGIQPLKGFKHDSEEWIHCIQWAKANGLADARARNCLAQAGITRFDQVTHDNLLYIPNCGEKTRNLLIQWAQSKLTELNSQPREQPEIKPLPGPPLF